MGRTPKWMNPYLGINTQADAILAALRSAGAAGMTKTEISGVVFSHNATARDINRALMNLLNAQLIRIEVEDPPRGCPAQHYYVL